MSDRSSFMPALSDSASSAHRKNAIAGVSSIDNQEHVADVMRLRMVLSGALLLWLVTIFMDWTVVRFVQPGPLSYFLWMRIVSFLIMSTLVGRLYLQPPPSQTAFRVMDLIIFSTASLTASLLCLRYRGISSPYAHALSCVLVGRGVSLPSHYRRGTGAMLLPVSMFPLTMLVAAYLYPDVRDQFRDPAQVSIFLQNVTLILVTTLLTILGGHTMWALRRQVFAARNIGRYRLQHRIGKGGMGEVWKAQHPTLRRTVAIKLLRGAASSPHSLARFEREVRATSELKHPNTIRVYDFGITEDGLWYYAMELLEGETLDSLVEREGPLPPDRAIRLIRQACRAMAEAHGRNIIHRDIKPENLFVTTLGGETDFIKVLDFGIVKLMDDELREVANVTGEGSLLGTPAYMSPEQFEAQTIDASTDVFSLGAVIYYMLTGVAPYRGPTLHAIRVAHQKPIEPPTALARFPIPTELEEVVMCCLERESARRYRSAAELDLALAAIEQLLRPVAGEKPAASAQHAPVTYEESLQELRAEDVDALRSLPDKGDELARTLDGPVPDEPPDK